MRTRIDFHNKLKQVCDNVYYMAPRNDKMVYPCIKYEQIRPSVQYANNHIYKHTKRYSVTYITKNPDDPVIDSIFYAFPNSSWDRQYKSDNLYHNVYEIYY